MKGARLGNGPMASGGEAASNAMAFRRGARARPPSPLRAPFRYPLTRLAPDFIQGKAPSPSRGEGFAHHRLDEPPTDLVQFRSLKEDHENQIGEQMARHKLPPQAVPQARHLRRDLTDAERKLWHLLRDRRLNGLKFRRQVPIGPYIADFACQSAKIIVEADGSQHAESKRDLARDAWLTARGYIVVRFWNHEILREPRMVLDTILARAGLLW